MPKFPLSFNKYLKSIIALILLTAGVQLFQNCSEVSSTAPVSRTTASSSTTATTTNTTNSSGSNCTVTQGGSVTPQTAGASCPLPWGGTIADGSTVTAYALGSFASCDGGCALVSEVRKCNNGILSGGYKLPTCTNVACRWCADTHCTFHTGDWAYDTYKAGKCPWTTCNNTLNVPGTECTTGNNMISATCNPATSSCDFHYQNCSTACP